jgi:hypothetical protein
MVTFWRQGFGEESLPFATQEKGVLWYSLLYKCFSQDARISAIKIKGLQGFKIAAL